MYCVVQGIVSYHTLRNPIFFPKVKNPTAIIAAADTTPTASLLNRVD